MKKIDRETTSRILDAADIVEVVSDFVTLRRSGSNYIGLCPFHNERTPSFSVSKAKGICKCFSCGKGGSPVNFLMELEQMSFQEALRWLARKYNIEIHEREETEKERQDASLRESLFALNQFALDHFERMLNDTDDGRDIGKAYFLERGLTPETISRFHLGYSLERGNNLYNDALSHGYTEENLIKTGLCARSERGVYDRFRGRVMYPVHSVSGKVVAFGGRTLRSDKTMAKYVNSPESEIYSKSRELYGLFQARRAIVKADKCILVEGYMDVLSMSQSGVENVVASSGTSLTSQQVNLLHRFTENVTVIYDADQAGIKASLRGIDMLLSENMNVKVVLFPPGEDPDSYARSHTREELAQYLAENETDFIAFKTRILLDGSNGDPIERSKAIASILKSIAVIPNLITRQIYIEECSRAFGMDAKVMAMQVGAEMAKTNEEKANQQKKTDAAKTIESVVGQESEAQAPSSSAIYVKAPSSSELAPFEKTILRYLTRYGMLQLCEAQDDDGNPVPMTVMEYVDYEFEVDKIQLTDPVVTALHSRLHELTEIWPQEHANLAARQDALRQELTLEGREKIKREATSMSAIEKAEKDLAVNVNAAVEKLEHDTRRTFFERHLISDPDDNIRRLATELIADKYQLSKLHSKFAHVETEEERLADLVPRSIFEYKDAILGVEIVAVRKEIQALSGSPDNASAIPELIKKLMELTSIRSEFARYLGERIVMPGIRK